MRCIFVPIFLTCLISQEPQFSNDDEMYGSNLALDVTPSSARKKKSVVNVVSLAILLFSLAPPLLFSLSPPRQFYPFPHSLLYHRSLSLSLPLCFTISCSLTRRRRHLNGVPRRVQVLKRRTWLHQHNLGHEPDAQAL